MILFYSSHIEDNTLFISEDEHLHCTKVLRHKKGDIIDCTDGKGYIYKSKIIDISKTKTTCNILESTYQAYSNIKLAIAISPTKNAVRLEWFVEKAVEIGIAEIYITTCQRTEKKSVNQQRLEKILVSAMKQSLNVHLPKLYFTKNLEQLFEIIGESYQQKFIAHCEGPTSTLEQLFLKNQDTIVLIGPEGDFTKNEIEGAITQGFAPVSLGKSRLRTETAGLVALMTLQLNIK